MNVLHHHDIIIILFIEPPLEETPPLNPFGAPPVNPFDNPPPPSSDKISVKTTWLPDVEFVDCNDVPVSTERVDNADVIGVRICHWLCDVVSLYYIVVFLCSMVSTLSKVSP